MSPGSPGKPGDTGRSASRVRDSSRDLDRGRRSFAARAWADAFAALSRAEQANRIGPDDLELLATAAYLVGRDDELLRALERAHHGYLDAGEPLPAVRCAFWLGIHLTLRREPARANGWLARARRIVERGDRDCAEQGYLLSGTAFQHLSAGDWEQARAAAAAAVEIGERFGDRDLVAIGLIDEGRSLAALGRVGDGLACLDEAMVAVTAGELSPIVSGLVYCSVIEGCNEVYELRRAQEWTLALAAWCEEQSDLVPFTGTCLLHRSEIMQLHGAWADALEEAGRARERFAERQDTAAAAQASYREGEVLRLRGELVAAEDAYRESSRLGLEPQPGLALLRLAQGDMPAAAASIRRATAETTDPFRRAKLLPAYVEIMLAASDLPAARSGCGELDGIAAGFESGMFGAIVAQARGAMALAEGDPREAIIWLRRAVQAWHGLDAPYECARARVLAGRAYRALGDAEAATVEVEVARAAFAGLGATGDLARLDAPPAAPAAARGLTGRELEVLRLVAAGLTNKAIAAELVLSERTVDRHVSNIFRKAHVSSRAAATAFAYEHRLV